MDISCLDGMEESEKEKNAHDEKSENGAQIRDGRFDE